MMSDPFMCIIEMMPVYQLGEDITLRFTMKNQTNEDRRILRWNTPLDGIDNWLRLAHEGTIIPYDGPQVLRGDPSPDEYVTVLAGASVSGSVELSTAYNLGELGNYEARVETLIQDQYATTAFPALARPVSSHQSCLLTSNTVHFRIIPGGTPRLTLGQQQRLREAEGRGD
jgi:hypothetical protein